MTTYSLCFYAISQLTSQFRLSETTLKTLSVDGGIFVGNQEPFNVPCLLGAPGTLYIGYTQPPSSTSDFQASVSVRNSKPTLRPLAATVIGALPPRVGNVNFGENTFLWTKYLQLEMNPACKELGQLSLPMCSSIAAGNATIVCANITAVDGFPTPEEKMGCKIQADSISFAKSQLMMLNISSASITCLDFTLMNYSSLVFDSHVFINATHNVNLAGPVVQTWSSQALSDNATLTIYSEGNVTLSQLDVIALNVQAKNIDIESRGQIIAANPLSPVSCYMNITTNNSACYFDDYLPNTIRLHASKYVTLGAESILRASNVFVCSSRMHMNEYAHINSNGLGCSATSGFGAGVTGLLGTPSGGGGGGYRGAGGNGMSIANSGGPAYGAFTVLNYGSGGGCGNNGTSLFCQNAGAGGGIVSVHVDNLLLHGNITANGAAGAVGSGGGSGGSVRIYVGEIMGDGYVLANGAAGGSGLSPGGGGGGGEVVLETFHTLKASDFSGLISSSGGPPGVLLLLEENVHVHNSQSQRASKKSVGVQAGAIMASAGQSGVVTLPNCAPGYGNLASEGLLCAPCAIGTYSVGGNGPCLMCTNRPEHAVYTQEKCTTSICPYECDSGYTTNQCYDPFQEFLYDQIGFGGFIGSCLAFFAVILIPLVYYRYKKYSDWGDKDKGHLDLFGKVFFDNTEETQSGRFRRRGTQNDHPILSVDSTFAVENPMFKADTDLSKDFDEKGEARWMRIRNLQYKSGREGRREFRMMDQDMIFHAYRMNLLGSNEPFSSRGGSWKLPLRRPDCLKPTLIASEYRAFAKQVNKLMEWNMFGAEMMLYYAVLFFTPPFAPYVLVRCCFRL